MCARCWLYEQFLSLPQHSSDAHHYRMHTIRKCKEIMKHPIVSVNLNLLCLARDSNQPTSSIPLELNS
ncbi:hypothetical protein Y032_0006g2788 [Ancylostoma ceylanicum]|uniref:Uncharacterized protein n=1 Tax=Ancylostoma ceylanicum TaxID=53326 RepID=A0A016VNG0_9BILA|nr:hypothetical protein Y032_0006g2788 [Ancylostoma ceylanicum]